MINLRIVRVQVFSKGVAWACVLGLGACSDAGTSPGVSTGLTGSYSGGTGDTTQAADSTDTETGLDTHGSAEGTGTTAGSAHAVDCNDPPLAAVGAAYQHQLQATDFPDSVTWQVEGLPEGMVFSPVTGAVTGAPTEQGTFDIDVTATGSGLVAADVCTLEVAEAVSIDLSGLGAPCIGPDDDVLVYVQGGNGAPVTCHTPGGSGNGTLPNGVSVDEDTCAIVGDPDDAYGTWVWITEVRQSGARAYVPYCVTELDHTLDAYGITADHSGGADNVLEPAVGTFTPGEPIAWGGEGDPAFLITGPCGENACYYGFAYTVSSSPFGGCAEEPCYGLAPAALANDAGGAPIGFTHELFARGPAVAPAFESRPFVLGWNIDYCIAPESNTCSGIQNIKDNGNGRLRFGVVMLPPSP